MFIDVSFFIDFTLSEEKGLWQVNVLVPFIQKEGKVPPDIKMITWVCVLLNVVLYYHNFFSFVMPDVILGQYFHEVLV